MGVCFTLEVGFIVMRFNACSEIRKGGRGIRKGKCGRSDSRMSWRNVFYAGELPLKKWMI